MRIAIMSDIHGNRTAFEAVLADLQQTSPDLVLHGGDLADAGSSPLEIVDRIRDLGWPGVVGNTDELIFRPESLEEFANQSSAPASLWTAIREMAATIRSMLGEERGISKPEVRLKPPSPPVTWGACVFSYASFVPTTAYFPALPWTLPAPVQKSQPVLPESPANGPQ